MNAAEKLFETWRKRPEPDAVRRERDAAFERWRSLPPPARTDEAWRRADPRRFDPEGLGVLPPLAANGVGFEDPAHDAFDAVITVTEDGYHIRDGGGMCASGRLRLEALTDAAARDEDGWSARSGRAASPDLPPSALTEDRFEAWAGAFWNVGFHVDVPAGAVLETGVLIDYRLNRPGAWIGPRLLVNVGAGASLALTERIGGTAAGRRQVAARREVFLGEGARAAVATIQTLPPDASFLAWDGARLAAGARLAWTTVPMGAGAVHTRAACDLAGAAAEAELYGLCFGTEAQQLGQKTLQIHSAPDTRSSLLYRGVVQDTARSVFQGIIVARRGAQHIDAYQKNNHLVLDDGARAESLPGLLIDADDLRCSHGSTIGNLDPEPLLYLRSRGLTLTQARRLMIEGFSDEVLRHLAAAPVRDAARRDVAHKLEPGADAIPPASRVN